MTNLENRASYTDFGRSAIEYAARAAIIIGKNGGDMAPAPAPVQC